MLLHQINNSYNTKLFEIFLYRNYPYEPHLHRAYEFIYVLEGKLDVTVQKNSFELSAGSCCLIAPYHIHSFSGEAVFSIVTFSGSYVASFTKHFEQYVSDLPCFSLSPHTDLYFRKSFLGDVVLTKKAMNLPDPPAMVIKSVLYGLCAEYAQKCPLRERSSKEETWFLDMLMYMEKNFVSDITLRDVAKSLGYNYEYISREFNKILGISFKTMLNQYRCERARYLIETTDQSLTEVAEQSGFQSIRSFNRVFKQQLGILPSELKRDRLRSLPRVNKGIHRSGK